LENRKSRYFVVFGPKNQKSESFLDVLIVRRNRDRKSTILCFWNKYFSEIYHEKSSKSFL